VLNALSAAALGFLLGLRHATDADHVVAITAIVARERKFSRAARIGALWGVGHSLTVLVIGGALILYRVAIPPRLGLGLEFLVALVLIGLGFSNLRAKPAEAEEKKSHTHDGLRPFTVGVVHGLAGSAAVVLLVLAAIPDPAWAIAYLIVFGLGTVAGMTIVTWLIAAPAVFAGQRVERFQRGIRLAAGSLSIVFGLILAHAIVVDGGLFSATPGWTPR
jgi:cytochrome c biogenesis protein CcdA